MAFSPKQHKQKRTEKKDYINQTVEQNAPKPETEQSIQSLQAFKGRSTREDCVTSAISGKLCNTMTSTVYQRVPSRTGR